MFYDFWLNGQRLWNLPLLVGLMCTGVFYGYMLISFTKLKLHHKQPLLFFLSLATLYVTIGSPLSSLSHLSFSLHMIQMSILFFLFPPLLMLGIPDSFPLVLKRLKKCLLPSKLALITFAILFMLYHTTMVLTFLSQHSSVHKGYLLVLLFLSMSMWRPIVVGKNKHFAYLSGLLLLPACGLFIVNAMVGGVNNPLFSQMTATLCISPSQLSTLTILPYPFNTRLDQFIAGILMIGVHKFAIILTVHLRNKLPERVWGGNG